MAEGGFEMENLGEDFTEYDVLTPDELDTSYEELSERMTETQDEAEIERLGERMVYIDTLRSLEFETDFGGTVTMHDMSGGRAEVANRTLIDIRTFIEKYKGFRINWGTPEGIDLRTRLGTTEGNNVNFNVIKENGDFGKKQIVLKRVNGVLEINRAKVAEKAVEQFDRMIDVTIRETRERKEFVDSLMIKRISIPRLFDSSHTLIDGLTDQENREHRGTLLIGVNSTPQGRTGDDGALQVQADYIDKQIEEVDIEIRGTEDPLEIERLGVRRRGLVQERDETVEQREFEEFTPEEREEMESVRQEQENDITRLQKVKEWLRENWLGASALAITVASLITTVIIGMRTVIAKGAKATQSFAKAVRDAIAKLGPWAVGLANLVYTILKAGASALAFLARNLWILVIALSYFLWEMYKERKKKR